MRGGRGTDGGRTNGRTADVDSFEGDKSKSRSEQKRNISIRPGNPQAELCVSRLHSKGCHFAPQCISNSAVLRCRSTDISIRLVLKLIGRSKSSIQYSRLHVHASQQKPIHRSLPQKLSQAISRPRGDCGGGELCPVTDLERNFSACWTRDYIVVLGSLRTEPFIPQRRGRPTSGRGVHNVRTLLRDRWD